MRVLVGLAIFLSTPAALAVSLAGLLWPEGRRWAIGGVVVSAALILWFGIRLVSAFTHLT